MQLLAAISFTVIVGYLFRIMAIGTKRPYDSLDIGIAGALLVAGLCGLGRILWLAFK